MKHILGLDLGTNSIGWAVISSSFDETTQKEQLKGIEAAGSRIIPMDAAQLGDFNKGNTVSQTANRTQFRGVRRLYERKKLRRERLHRILQLLGFLPKHYANQLDRYGKFIANSDSLGQQIRMDFLTLSFKVHFRRCSMTFYKTTAK